MKKLSLTTMAIVLFTTLAFSQKKASKDSVSNPSEKQNLFRKYSIGSSLFSLYNFSSDPADYYLLNFGYRLSQKNNIFIEAFTWKYSEPMGTYGNSEELYPGKVKAYGIGAGYQRFHWKNLFTTVEATPIITQYYDSDNDKIQKGFQLYLQLILGYRFEFFNKRWFIEPAYAIKYWPVNTNLPSDFAVIEKGTPKYIFEPSLNFGFKF